MMLRSAGKTPADILSTRPQAPTSPQPLPVHLKSGLLAHLVEHASDFSSSPALTRLLDIFRLVLPHLAEPLLPCFQPLLPLLRHTTRRTQAPALLLRSIDILSCLVLDPALLCQIVAVDGVLHPLLPLLSNLLNNIPADYEVRHRIVRLLGAVLTAEGLHRGRRTDMPALFTPLRDQSSQEREKDPKVFIVSRLILMIGHVLDTFETEGIERLRASPQLMVVTDTLRLLILLCNRFEEVVNSIDPCIKLTFVAVIQKVRDHQEWPEFSSIAEQVQLLVGILFSN